MSAYSLALAAANPGLLGMAFMGGYARYPSYLSCYHSDAATREQTGQQALHHGEVMGALRGLQKGSITAAVLASAVLPLCEQALATLEGPATDYDRAMSNWIARVNRVDAWKSKRECKARERAKEALEAEKEQFIADHVRKHSRWWRSPKQVAAQAKEAAYWKFYPRSMRDPFLDFGWPRCHRQHAKSRPQPPEGYGDLPAIRDLKSAACISPEAQLTVPIETIKKLMRWVTP